MKQTTIHVRESTINRLMKYQVGAEPKWSIIERMIDGYETLMQKTAERIKEVTEGNR